MEKYYTDTRDIAPNQEKMASGMEEKVILAFNLLNSGDSNLKEGEKTETGKKIISLREGLESLRKEVREMGIAEFSFWIVNTILLFLIVLKEFILI